MQLVSTPSVLGYQASGFSDSVVLGHTCHSVLGRKLAFYITAVYRANEIAGKFEVRQRSDEKGSRY